MFSLNFHLNESFHDRALFDRAQFSNTGVLYSPESDFEPRGYNFRTFQMIQNDSK